MPYQDELNALYARADSLERALRERVEREDNLLSEFKAVQEKVGRLEAGKLPTAKMSAWIGGCVAASVVSSMIAALIVSAPREKAPEEIFQDLPKVQTPKIEVPVPPVVMAEPPRAVEEEKPPAPSTTSPRWYGKVSASQGMPWGAGDSCFVEMPLVEFEWNQLGLDNMYIYCSNESKKDELVYSWSQGRGKKTSQKYLQVDGKYKGIGAFEATERGVSMEQPELTIDTTKKQARLFYSVSKEPKEMTISLERITAPMQFAFEKSNANYTEPILIRDTTAYKSTVQERAGAVPASFADACSLQVGPHKVDYKPYKKNCMFSLTCGAWSLSNQLALCVLNEGESLKSFEWRERGQSLTVDLTSNTGEFLDVSGATSWGVDLSITQ